MLACEPIGRHRRRPSLGGRASVDFLTSLPLAEARPIGPRRYWRRWRAGIVSVSAR